MSTVPSLSHAPNMTRTTGIFYRVLLPALLLATTTHPIPLPAQIAPTGVSATVHVDSVYYRGDTLFLAHSVTNAATSPRQLLGFVLQTPAAGAAQNKPAGGWLLHTGRFGGVRTVQWIGISDDAMTPPGRRMAPLITHGVGIPDVEQFWIIADTPPPVTENPDREPPIDPMIFGTIPGLTVGISVVPVGAAPVSLTTRLRRLLGRACDELGWLGDPSRVASSTRAAYRSRAVNVRSASPSLAPTSDAARLVSSASPATCQALDAQLVRARRALADGAAEQARSAITDFATSLDSLYAAPEPRQVNSAGYALLRGNATYLLSRL
jgi:hypothetical protein